MLKTSAPIGRKALAIIEFVAPYGLTPLLHFHRWQRRLRRDINRLCRDLQDLRTELDGLDDYIKKGYGAE